KNAEDLCLMRENISQQLNFAQASTEYQLSSLIHEEDLGEAPYIGNLYGREEECARMAHWIVDHHCQVVAMLGMGGVGKTVVAAKVAVQVRQSFEYVFWRSLQNAPPLELL